MFLSDRMMNWCLAAAVSASKQILSISLDRSVAVEEQVMSITADFQPRWLVVFIVFMSPKERMGFSNHNLWQMSALGSNKFPSGPTGQARDITIFSLKGSIGGLVTW